MLEGGKLLRGQSVASRATRDSGKFTFCREMKSLRKTLGERTRGNAISWLLAFLNVLGLNGGKCEGDSNSTVVLVSVSFPDKSEILSDQHIMTHCLW